jgi:hypothetical protein
VLAMFPALLGSSEHRLPGSPQRLLARLNAALRDEADDAGIGLLALDDRVARHSLTAWHDPMVWHSAKQEVSPPPRRLRRVAGATAGGIRTVSGRGMPRREYAALANTQQDRTAVEARWAATPRSVAGPARRIFHGAEALALLGRQDEAAQLRAEHRHHFAR